MNVLITGGAGFIGSNLAERLLKEGANVLAFDSFNDFYDPAIKRRNVEAVRRAGFGDRFWVEEGDIRDEAALECCFARFLPEVVVHLAAYAGVRPSIEKPELYCDVNLMGTVRVLEAMRKFGVKRLAFASSSSVYGNNPKVPFSEDDAVDHPISPYAATKKAGELLLHTYHVLHGMSCACLRFFTVYGPRQRPDLAISKFAARMRAGQPIDMYGDGGTMRDYTYIDDIVDGVVRAMEWTAGEPKYQLFNLGESHTVSLREMIDTVADALGVTPEIRKLPPQPGDVERTFADTRRAREVLGYRPSTDFSEGVRKYVKWLDQLNE